MMDIETAEGYVLTSDGGVYLLGQLALHGLLPAARMEELFGGWEDWRLVTHLVLAGYAIDGPSGLLCTKKTRDTVEKLFDKSP